MVWSNGWTKRLLFGMHYDSNQFVPTPVTTLPANPVPPDRTLSYPFVGFDVLEDNYAKIGDENQIGRTEDLYFGTDVSGELGYSTPAFGADRNAVILAAKIVRGLELADTSTCF